MRHVIYIVLFLLWSPSRLYSQKYSLDIQENGHAFMGVTEKPNPNQTALFLTYEGFVSGQGKLQLKIELADGYLSQNLIDITALIDGKSFIINNLFLQNQDQVESHLKFSLLNNRGTVLSTNELKLDFFKAKKTKVILALKSTEPINEDSKLVLPYKNIGPANPPMKKKTNFTTPLPRQKIKSHKRRKVFRTILFIGLTSAVWLYRAHSGYNAGNTPSEPIIIPPPPRPN